jgi:peptidoglycan-associated lipoprotein
VQSRRVDRISWHGRRAPADDGARGKETFMVGRCASAVLVSLMVAAVGFGCASQSGSTQASTASSNGSDSGNGAGSNAMMPVSQSERHSTMASTGLRPVLRDFVAMADLRDVHFEFDRYDIRPAAATILEATASWLKAHPDHRLLIEGHTDERGTNEYNVSLGERRAKASMNYLTSHGIQTTRITVISYGEERNVCGERTESCWSKNRRAHFMVTAR